MKTFLPLVVVWKCKKKVPKSRLLANFWTFYTLFDPTGYGRNTCNVQFLPIFEPPTLFQTPKILEEILVRAHNLPIAIMNFYYQKIYSFPTFAPQGYKKYRDTFSQTPQQHRLTPQEKPLQQINPPCCINAPQAEALKI